MAKKKEIEAKQKRVLVFSPDYKGYLDEMPEEAKAALIARNPKAEILFNKQTNTL